MKKYFSKVFLSFSLLASNFSHSQNLSINDLLKIYGKSFEIKDTHLASKGYIIFSKDAKVSGSQGTLVTTWNNNCGGSNFNFSKDIFTCHKIGCTIDSVEVLDYTIYDDKEYLKLREEMKVLNFTLKKTDANQGQAKLNYFFENSSYLIQLMVLDNIFQEKILGNRHYSD